MLTRWGRDLDPELPLPEYPRPQLQREEWVNLNGIWEYAVRADAARPENYDGPIVVPFSPEAPLSSPNKAGVGHQLRPEEWLWYRRTFTPPSPPPDGRVLLHFGAVDQSCTVWVDGTEVGSHTGGYLPFTLDITEALRGESPALLEVRVRDLSETGAHARGKQRLDRGTIWYTAQSGIWQTVWAEAVPSTSVEALRFTPALDAEVLQVEVVSRRPGAAESPPLASGAEVTVRVGDTVVHGAADTTLAVPLPEARLWSPEDPQLYDVEVTLGADRVRSYAAMRSFGVGTDAAGHRRLLLNGSPYQHRGVLDQGYWPDGLLTAPSDAAMVHDLETVKALGFNTVRKHVKVEPLRWYAHCDRIGLLVWQDFVNGGGRYRSLTTHLPARRPVRLRDRHYELFGRQDAAARAQFRAEGRRTVELLANCVCVAVWVPFNEAWGQFDANEIAREVKAQDPTRQVNHVSGWIDQGGGDIRSFHRYLKPFRMPRRRGRRALALTEYGGHSLPVPGHTWSTREYGYGHLDSKAALAEDFDTLHRDVIRPACADGLAATIYTQLTDVEDELNGLLTWDREVVKLDAAIVREVLGLLRGRGR